MKTKPEHTPTLWRTENLSVFNLDGKRTLNLGIKTDNGRIALLGKNQQANGEFIICACNSYEVLLEVLTIIANGTQGEHCSQISRGQMQEYAKFAIAKATV